MTLKEQIAEAVEELGAIPYFPKESGARFAIMRGVEAFVSGPAELRWLIDNAVGHMREWGGMAELRGLYCTRYKPKDGKEEYCSVPGFTPADSENAFYIEAAKHKARELAKPREADGLKRITAAIVPPGDSDDEAA